jgi:hypothetical protein
MYSTRLGAMAVTHGRPTQRGGSVGLLSQSRKDLQRYGALACTYYSARQLFFNDDVADM